MANLKLHLRNATIDDLERLTQIAISVMPQEPPTLYQYPKMDKYPEDVYKYTRSETKKFIENTDEKWDYHIMLCEKETPDSKSMETIALAVWEVSALHGKESLLENSGLPKVSGEGEAEKNDDGDDSGRRDADPARIKYYQGIINAARRQYLELSGRKDGPLSYIHLTRLATHPTWQRHGAGTSLTQWGINIAEEQKLAIGLFGTPLGEKLYKELGFKELKRITVQMPGEEESVTVSCMKREPSGSN